MMKKHLPQLNALAILFLLPGISGFAAAEWLNDVLLFGDTPLPGQFQDSPAVHVWGKTIEYPEQREELRQAVNFVHAEGGYYVGTISAFSPEPKAYAENPSIMAARVTDINGDLSEIKWKTSAEEPVYFFNTNLPAYRDYLRKQMYDLIDAGVDAILVDEIEGTAGTIQRGGSFGPEDMAMFNEYLLDQYTPEELQAWFEIDIETFDYGVWIRGKGLAQVWENKPWNVTLYNNYRFFQRERVKEVMAGLIADARAYARNTYGREIAFSANIFGFHPHQMLFSDLLDYFTVEYGYRADLFAPDGHATPFLRYGNDRGKPSILLPSVYTGNLVHSWNTRDIFRLWTMEAYATGNAFMNARGFFAGKDVETGEFLELIPDTQERKETFHFIEDNGYLFSDKPHAEIALLYSFGTDHINWAREEWAGTAYALLDAHVQYDIISMGNEPWLEERFTSFRLMGYDAIVLTAAKNMSESQINILQNYVAAGGTLVVVGDESGGFNLNNQRFEYPDWEAMTAPGSRTYGSGKVTVLPNAWGLDYFENRDSGRIPELVDPLLASADPITETDAPSTLHILTSLGSGSNGTDKGLFLHLLNYDFNLDSQLIRPTDSFTIEVTVPDNLTSDELQVYRYAVGEDPRRVQSLRSGNTITISADPVHVYAAYAVLVKSDARQLADQAIARMNGELTGASSASARSQEVVNARLLALQLYAQDHFIEARFSAKTAADLIEGLSRKRILHTERNGEIASIHSDRAALIFPQRPEKGYLGELQARLDDEYTFETDLDNWLSEQDLSVFDVIVISSPWSHFQAVEETALLNYLFNGGSVLMLGNPFRNGALNPLLKTFDITVHEEALSIDEGDQFGIFPLKLYGDAPEGLPDTPLITNWPTRLSVGGDSVVVASSGPSGWLDEIEVNQQLDPGESRGDFALAAAASYGDGRLFVMADSAFDDAILRVHRNDVFMRDALNWLTEKDSGLDAVLTLTPGTHGKVIASPTQSAYRRGSEVTLTAVPDPGYAFANWAGDLSGISNPISLTMIENKIISADFREAVEPTITVQPRGSTIVSGRSASLSVQASNATAFIWYTGETGDTSDPVLSSSGNSLTDSPQATTRYWVRAFSADNAYTDSQAVEVKVDYTLTASASPGGSLSLDPFMSQYPAGTVVTVAANPNSGMIFGGWSGSADGTTNPLLLTMDENKVLNALFATADTPVFDRPPQDSLIVKGDTLILSADVSNAVYYQWYRGRSGDGSDPVAGATLPSLQVSPESTTEYWLSATSSVGTQAFSATATVKVLYRLLIQTNGNGAIQVSPNQSTYEAGEAVTLTAFPASNYRFGGWSGDVELEENPLNITLNDSLELAANFVRMGDLLAPEITGEPGSRIVGANSEIVLELTATGPDLTYQWYNGTSGDESNPIAGATGNRLVIGGIDQGAYLWARVSNPAGSADTSTITLVVGLGSGWEFNELGLVYNATWPWVFHSEFGWIYAWTPDGGTQAEWFYAIHSQLNCWIWTHPDFGLWMYMKPAGFSSAVYDWWVYARDVSEMDWDQFYFILGSDQSQYFGGDDAW